MSKTLAHLRQSLADRHDAGILPTSSSELAFRDRLLNRGKDYCVSEMGKETTATVTVTNGTGTLPTDFDSIGSVASGNVFYTQASPSDTHSGLMFWITGDETNGYILNTTSDGDFDISYVNSLPDMVATSDVCQITDGEAIVAYAYAMLRKSETDPLGDAEKSLNECQSRIESMISENVANDKPLEFIIP